MSRWLKPHQEIRKGEKYMEHEQDVWVDDKSLLVIVII
jgi:hypothetical protein